VLTPITRAFEMITATSMGHTSRKPSNPPSNPPEYDRAYTEKNQTTIIQNHHKTI